MKNREKHRDMKREDKVKKRGRLREAIRTEYPVIERIK
jgi:hypothetical protein